MGSGIVLVDQQGKQQETHPYAVSVTITKVNPLLEKHEIVNIEKLLFEGEGDAMQIFVALVNYLHSIIPKPPKAEGGEEGEA